MRAFILALKPRHIAMAAFEATMICYLHMYYFPLSRALFSPDDTERYEYYAQAFFRIAYWLPIILFMLWLIVFIVHYKAAQLTHRLLHFFKPIDLILTGIASAILLFILTRNPDMLPNIVYDMFNIQGDEVSTTYLIYAPPILTLLMYLVPGLFFIAAISLWIMRIGQIDQGKSKIGGYPHTQDERITQFLLELRVRQQTAREAGHIQAEQTYQAVRQLAERTLK